MSLPISTPVTSPRNSTPRAKKLATMASSLFCSSGPEAAWLLALTSDSSACSMPTAIRSVADEPLAGSWATALKIAFRNCSMPIRSGLLVAIALWPLASGSASTLKAAG